MNRDEINCKESSGYMLATVEERHPVYVDEAGHRLMSLHDGVFTEVSEAAIVYYKNIIPHAIALANAVRATAPDNIRGRIYFFIGKFTGSFAGVYVSLNLYDGEYHSWSYRNPSTSKYDNTGWEEVRGMCNSLDYTFNGTFGKKIGVKVNVQTILSMIGLDQVVTFDSLFRWCAKDQETPRFQVGDVVTWNRGKRTGTITTLRVDKAGVIDTAGKKCTASYKSMVHCKSKDIELEVDIVLPEHMKVFTEVLNGCKLWRAKEEKMTLDHPFLSGENTVIDARVFRCPNCGGPSEVSKGYGDEMETTKCVMCGQQMAVVSVDDGVGTFVVMPKPQKNRFCLEEAKCCGNCGVFRFEYGRQGKRSTGYCLKTNQCVQAFNTCVTDAGTGGWLPRTPAKYSKSISQHTTNLGYGVADNRNRNRNQEAIEDLIYRKADHEAERERAKVAMESYRVGYAWFQQQIVKRAEPEQVHSLYEEE